MISWMRGRLTYANVLVTALAFVVLGGTAVAATLVTGKQIKDGTITGKDVKNHSLTKKDFKGSVRGPQGVQGIQGPQGIQGVKGDSGAPGATSVKVHTASKAITSGSSDTVSVFCPTGERAVGGGGEVSFSSAFLVASRPSVRNGATAQPAAEGDIPNGWTVTATRDTAYSGSPTVTAYVICTAP